MALYIVWLTMKYVVSIFLNPFWILDLTWNNNTIDVRFCQVMACIWSDILERQKNINGEFHYSPILGRYA
mgnify:CR=1 FL=1